MSYRIVKNLFGTSTREVVSIVDIPYTISDFCFIPEFGYLLALRDNHCIAHVDINGGLTLPWVGALDEPGQEDGSREYARLSYPSSLSYVPKFRKVFVIEGGGAILRAIELDSGYIHNVIGSATINRLKKMTAKLSVADINTACYANNLQEVYWCSDRLNRCFRFRQGDVDCILGNGKQGYSVSSDFRKSTLYYPSGITVVSNAVYVSDKGNHCIRELTTKRLRLFEGTPIEKDIVDAPSKLKTYKGVFYYVDGDSIKHFSPNGPSRGSVYEGNGIVSLDMQGNNLLILEKEDAT